MNKIYKKNEVTFAVILIVIYVVGTSLAETVSPNFGSAKLIPCIFHVAFIAILLIWIKKNDLFEKYGLVFPKYRLSKVWFFIPLIIVAFFGMLPGIKVRYSAVETLLFVISMLCVGFLEEIIFRGFLFVGMARKNIRAAIIVSSVTFGIGHIVNLLNGKALIETLIQIVFAIAVGFTLVILFYRGKSILPCIAFHGLNNALSAFEMSNEEVSLMLSVDVSKFELIFVTFLVVVLVVYSLYLLKNFNRSEGTNGDKDITDSKR